MILSGYYDADGKLHPGLTHYYEQAVRAEGTYWHGFEEKDAQKYLDAGVVPVKDADGGLLNRYPVVPAV